MADAITAFDQDDVGLDVRVVSVIWGPGEPFPVVEFSGCSAYEAIGFLRTAGQKLEREFRLAVEEDIFGDDD